METEAERRQREEYEESLYEEYLDQQDQDWWYEQQEEFEPDPVQDLAEYVAREQDG